MTNVIFRAIIILLRFRSSVLKGIIDRFLLWLIGSGIILLTNFSVMEKVVVILMMVLFFSISVFFEDRKGELVVDIIVGALCVALNTGLPLLLILIYDVATDLFKKKKKTLFVLLGTVLVCGLFSFIGRDYYFIATFGENWWIVGLFATGLVLSIYFAYSTVHINMLYKEKIRLRDDNEEIVRLERARRALIVRNQDAEIQMATLKERNRIAREIHDNVGHLLSRCILQLGAVRMVHKEETVAEELASVLDGLNESMTSIRKSVHDLHNEAVDLKQSIEKLIESNSEFTTDFEYDAENDFPMKIKYCIISVITEGFQNAVKHSNGDSISILVREHPGMYQVVFQDNGTGAVIKEDGIGLHNIENRVRELGGMVSFSVEKGFRIFISIPKEAKNETGNS